ncbi:MAG TPA: hypothetical protein VGD45_13215 [Steroidobacter sp.]|uniref:hypothetical protein n=1 Tax=Steroidobacter sp. TaxID=1978227 RepID=UPI002ED947CE
MPLTESLRFDWKSLRAAGSAEGVPAAIERLRDAKTSEEATRAYWRIDNTVIVQGALYEAAEHTVPCVLSVLSDCTESARPWALELLFQLGAGGTHRVELQAGNKDIDERCRAAVKLGVAMYFYYLEHGAPEESGFCADLIELCARDDEPIALRGRWWLKRLIGTTQDERLRGIYQTCLMKIEASLESGCRGED